MAVQRQNILMDELLDLLVSTPTPQQIIEFRTSDEIMERLRYLVEQDKNSRLTPNEREEFDELGSLFYFLSKLKIRTRQKLAGQ